MEKSVMGDLLMPNVTWSLTGEGMDILERAGLAGLYLTLTAAQEWAEMGDSKAQELSRILKWRLDDKAVELKWDGPDLEVLTKLVEWAWQIREGIYYLPGIHRGADMREHGFLRLHTHSGLLGTFLQYSGRLGPRVDDPTELLITFDEQDPRKTIGVHYRPIIDGESVRQPAAIKTQKICPLRDKTGTFRTVSMPGWASPGAAMRFGKNDQNWTGTADKAFLLLFTPIACLYMSLPRTKAKKKMRDNWAFLVPETVSLNEISHKYRQIQAGLQRGIEDIKILCLGDAALRFAIAYSGKTAIKGFSKRAVYVVAMSITDYYSSNIKINPMIRKTVIQLCPDRISVNRYRLTMNFMPNVFEHKTIRQASGKGQDEDDDKEMATHWLRRPRARGHIAENLVNGEPWYADLLWPPKWQADELAEQLERRRRQNQESISTEHLWFNNLQKEGRGLMKLVQEESMWNSQEEQRLVSMFHSTLRRLLDKEALALSRGGSRNLRQRWDDRVDKIRRELMRGKTMILTRKVIIEMVAEGGGSKDLTENKETLWLFLNHPQHWKKARDLALLALVTFTDGRLAKI